MKVKDDHNFLELLGVLRKLRAPGGCDWDRAQTAESLVPYLLEETYEVIESIDRQDYEGLKEELGDLCLHVLFQAELAKDKGQFEISDSLKSTTNKLINRHPHVFNPELNNNKSWEEQKKEEKKRDSVLEGVPKALPALTRSQRIQEKASSVGFDWDAAEPIWKKINEEIDELKDAHGKNDINNIKEEIGDVLFSVVNLARFLNIDAESSLRKTIVKFETRFKKIEKHFENLNMNLKDVSLEEMDKIWEKAKKE
tara:strand:- start:46 stop:807 length:762 start_codon:yes stop_codon:yes gene_type:complete